MASSAVVDELFRVFNERGHRSYGEAVTELMHALQCATFAHERGESPEVVAACLLHDYGHLLHDLGEDIAEKGVDSRHEHVGANRLSGWFGPAVVEPIRLHAASKRYLCWKESGYYDGLSEASRRSLALQGGPMTAEEAAAFEAGPFFDNAVRVRRYDDQGKVPDMRTPPLESFRILLESLVLPRL
jgi:phosphonate degradation associated HDIG domain protein